MQKPFAYGLKPEPFKSAILFDILFCAHRGSAFPGRLSVTVRVRKLKPRIRRSSPVRYSRGMRARRILAYSAIYILWGGSFLGIREVVAVLPPFFAAGFRFFFAGLFLLLYAAVASKESREGHSITRQQWLGAALLGLIMFVGDYACLFWAEQRISSGIASVISATIPVCIFTGEVFLLHTQRITAKSLAGIMLGFLGVVVLTWQSMQAGSSGLPAGMFVAFAGVICWSAGTLLSRRLTLPASRVVSAGWQMWTGGVMLFLVAAATGELRRLPPAHLAFSPRVVGSMTYLIVAASIVAFTSYVWLLGHEPMGRVASYAYVNPVVALALGAWLASERLSVLQVAGSGLVVVGVFATLTGKAPVPAKEKAQVTAPHVPGRLPLE
jgi:drug/metabolite transporter (DMT)-like permease